MGVSFIASLTSTMYPTECMKQAHSYFWRRPSEDGESLRWDRESQGSRSHTKHMAMFRASMRGKLYKFPSDMSSSKQDVQEELAHTCWLFATQIAWFPIDILLTALKLPESCILSWLTGSNTSIISQSFPWFSYSSLRYLSCHVSILKMQSIT